MLYPLSYVGLAGHRILRLRPWRGHSHLTRPPVRLGCMTTIPTYDQFHHPSSNGEDEMSQTGDWSPDEPLGTETFEQGDDAIDEKTELDPSFLEAVELDPSLDPTLQVDDRELEEAGAEFDDVAMHFSKDASASVGGEIGFVRRGAVLPEIGAVMWQ